MANPADTQDSTRDDSANDLNVPGSTPGTFSLLGAIGLAILTGVGAVGWLTGSGWFSYRTMLYGSGELYAINLGDQPRTVSVDGRGPETVPPDGKGHFELIGGTSSVQIHDPDGQLVDDLSVTTDQSDALVKVSNDGCLAAVDISFMYQPGTDSPDQLPIDARIQADQHIYVPDTTHVVWPRQAIPTTLTGADTAHPRSIWIETCGCELLKPDNASMLDTYLSVELQARLERSTESKRPHRRPRPGSDD